MMTRRERAQALAAFHTSQSREYNRDQKLEPPIGEKFTIDRTAWNNNIIRSKPRAASTDSISAATDEFGFPISTDDTTANTSSSSSEGLEEFDDFNSFHFPTSSGTEKKDPSNGQSRTQEEYPKLLGDKDVSLSDTTVTVSTGSPSMPPQSNSKLPIQQSQRQPQSCRSSLQPQPEESPSKSLSESSFESFLFDVGTDVEDWMALMEWDALASEVTLASLACVESTAQGVAQITSKLVRDNKSNKLTRGSFKKPWAMPKKKKIADEEEKELGVEYLYSSPTQELVSSKVEAEKKTKRKRIKSRLWHKSRAK